MQDLVKLAPYKYNGGQNYMDGRNQSEKKAKYTINLDWLECTFSTPFFLCSHFQEPRNSIVLDDLGVAFVRDETRFFGTKHYRHVYECYLNGEHFSTLLCNPRSKIIDKFNVQMKVENHVLYEKGMIDRLGYIAESCNMVTNNMTRLDIAVDGQGFIEDYSKLIKGSYEKVGKAKMKTEHNAACGVDGFYIGGRGSEKFLRGYNKTRELQQSSHCKDYIKRFWDNNNLDVSEDVERLEITMRSKAIKRITDFDINKLDDSAYLAGIMKCSLEKWYQFRIKDNNKNVSRKTKVDAVDWSFFSPTEVIRENKIDKPNIIWAVQRAISFEMQEFFASQEVLKDDLFAQAYAKSYERASRYGILDWYNRKLPMWSKDREYHKEIRKQLDITSSRKSFDMNRYLDVQ